MFLLEMRVEKIHRTLLLSPLLPLSLSCSPVPCVISSIAFGFGHSISHSVAVRFNYWESHKPKPPMLRGATYGRMGGGAGAGISGWTDGINVARLGAQMRRVKRRRLQQLSLSINCHANF